MKYSAFLETEKSRVFAIIDTYVRNVAEGQAEPWQLTKSGFVQKLNKIN